MRWILTWAAAVLLAACQPAPKTLKSAAPEGRWIQLFNGRDLDGWTPKFVSRPVGENLLDTFRVENGVLKVSYDRYDRLDGRFGHLFYSKRPFSRYWLRVEYRFVGKQVAGAPDWAYRNNGLMLHSQPVDTMELNQDFPASVETRLLGGGLVGARPTGALCTPGSSVRIGRERPWEHCQVSNAPTFRGDQWVLAEVEVLGAGRVRQYINGELVMEYTDLELDEPQPWSPSIALASGYIAIQAESHPTEFRRIELLDLGPAPEGPADP